MARKPTHKVKGSRVGKVAPHEQNEWGCLSPNLSITLHKDEANLFRVAVWGEDDLGWEKPNLEPKVACKLFIQVPTPTPVAWLKNQGFIRA